MIEYNEYQFNYSESMDGELVRGLAQVIRNVLAEQELTVEQAECVLQATKEMINSNAIVKKG
ncbi:hypothetical protein BMT55_13930 [Listeria newyorkensis]|uniref:Uncharacterized protein n=1 Tax=Listeria newyorkensis TaxID=1497681 RepID=A0ABX4XJZ8_9LIST|nr:MULTISPECIES: hypothetical protein [Listeria]PNP88966.1 hypothetical protein BMT55_13930 [Listeria newyorkensis]RQW65740.1 hypothetical protein DUK53_15235 [Listeria sp. SHR_NRA_18]